MTVNLVRGTVVDDMLGRNPQHRKEILARWTRLAGVALTGPWSLPEVSGQHEAVHAVMCKG
jgi:hypothetical protein